MPPTARAARSGEVGVVIATRNRSQTLIPTLARLRALPERPEIVVVDNASSDETPVAVRLNFPEVRVIELERNIGAAARTVGARALSVDYVAFSDDDSWWAPGALRRAARLLAAHPRLAVVAARVLVGRERRLDPVSAAIAASGLEPAEGLPGIPAFGFLACGIVARREAFLAVGGFHPRLGIGGEEELLALDLAAAGWRLRYVDEVVAFHDPPGRPDRASRTAVQARNALWTAWLRYRPIDALRRTAAVLGDALGDRAVRGGALAAACGATWVLRERRALPRDVSNATRRIDGHWSGR